jgi:hypothetical protein
MKSSAWARFEAHVLRRRKSNLRAVELARRAATKQRKKLLLAPL